MLAMAPQLWRWKRVSAGSVAEMFLAATSMSRVRGLYWMVAPDSVRTRH